MATVEKTLGQAAPAATTATDLYTVPASTSTVVTTINVCNRATANTTFRVSIAVGGGATADKDYIYYDYTIEGYMTVRIDNARYTLAATDVVRVYAGNANLSFGIYGSERS